MLLLTKKFCILTKLGVNLLWSSNLLIELQLCTKKNTLKHLLVNEKISVPNKFFKAGIYQTSCENCYYIYLGLTGRYFNIRFTEKLRYLRLNKTHFNVATTGSPAIIQFRTLI